MKLDLMPTKLMWSEYLVDLLPHSEVLVETDRWGLLSIFTTVQTYAKCVIKSLLYGHSKSALFLVGAILAIFLKMVR